MNDLSSMSDAELKALQLSLKSSIAALNAAQLAVKVNLNSAYGVFSSPMCMWYTREIGEAITFTGRLIARAAIEFSNEYINKILQTGDVDYVMGGDTDSFFVNMDPLVRKFCPDGTIQKQTSFLDEVCKGKMIPVINNAMKAVCQKTNAYSQSVVFKREIIASQAFFTKKKRYAMYVHDKEGTRYEKPKLKIVGLDIVRSSTPTAARGELKDMVLMVFTSNEKAVQERLAAFRKRWMTLPVNDIAFPRGVKDIKTYYDERIDRIEAGAPIHVKAAIAHNRLVIKKNLQEAVPMISPGDKIRFAYLKKRNPLNNNCIGWVGDLHPSLEIESYIDYEEQFEIGFASPARGILEAVGWKLEDTPDLDELFG